MEETVECLQIDALENDGGFTNRETSIAWRNLGFEVSQFAGLSLGKKTILRGLNGSLQRGSLNGLLGPSGAGKTTLLSCLSGSLSSGLSPSSAVYCSEKNPTSYFIAQNITESIVGELTVGQILKYAFKFKNGPGNPKETINKVLTDLLLDPSILDRPFSLCSGGEQKRIAIAQELMSHQSPSFLFLDEPTTGLDSAAAYEVVSSLQALTRTQGITVFASIHAPNHETLHLFDQLQVLTKGGLCIFSGHPTQIKGFLQSQLELAISPDVPPIEVLVKIASNHLDTPEIRTLAIQTQLTSSPLNITQLHPTPNGLPHRPAPFTLSSLVTLTSRQALITFISRHRFFLLQLLIHFLNVLFLSSLFPADMTLPSGCTSSQVNLTCQAVHHAAARLQENINFHVFTGAIEGFVLTCTSTLLFSSLVSVFISEHRNSWYSLSSFFWSLNLISILELSCYVLVISVTAYFATGQHAADGYQINWTRLGLFASCFWCLGLYTQSLGQLIGVLVLKSPVLAVVSAVMLYMTLDITNDFLFKTDEFRSQALVTGTNVIGLKYLTKYVIYICYGFERCSGSEDSWVLAKHYVSEDDVWFYVRRILENSAVMRAATLLVLWLKFSAKPWFWRKRDDGETQELREIEFEKTQEFGEMRKFGKEATEFEKSDGEVMIAWRHLSLSASRRSLWNWQTADETRLILRQLNGEVRFGSLNALMGTSGAGKTSLLKVLNGRSKTRLSKETEFYISKNTPITTCFISQEVSGHLMPGLTAQQMLTYASRLKNHQKGVDHEAIALKWLGELDLLNTRETKVERCSGGERKRLAVALELTALAMPNCVCIDEPTSGLDTNSAEIVISTLRRLTRSHPITIITSIHQPTTEVLHLFDSLYVLSRGGNCIYAGPPTTIQAHLSRLPNPPTPTSNYPIETLIQLSSLNHSHPLIKTFTNFISAQFTTPPSTLQPTSSLSFTKPTHFSLSTVTILTQRYFILFLSHLWAEYFAFYLILIFYSLSLHLFWDSRISLTSGCLRLQMAQFRNSTCSTTPERSQIDKDLDNSLKYIFFMFNIFLLLILLQSSLRFFRDLRFYLSEHRNGWYSSTSFYVFKTATEIIPLLPILSVYLLISDIYSANLRPAFYLPFLSLLILSVFASQGMAHLIVLLSGNHIAILTLVFMLVYDCFLMLSNFFINVSRLNLIYRLVSWFSISRWTFEAVLLLVYGFGRCDEESEVQPVLEWLGLKDEDYGRCWLMLAVNCLVFRCIALGLLRLRK